ncbi:MAG: phosphodiester glycosidase family protein [Candidatus Limnocylindrales bacterium]
MNSIVLTSSAGRRLALATAIAMIVAVPFASVAEAGITKPFTPDNTIELSPGVTYQVGRMKTTGGRPQSVRVGIVDADDPNVQLKALLSNGKVVQRQVVRRIALKRSRAGFRPMIATNGDMSVRDRVDAYAAPLSMAVSGGELMVAQTCVRPTLGVDADGDVRIGNVRADVSVTPPGKKYTVRVHRVNTHRDDGLVVLFTRRFAASTRTTGGREVVLDMEGKLEPNGTQRVRVVKVRKGGNTTLNWGQAVLSVKNPSQKWVYGLKVGQTFELKTQVVRRVDKPCGGTVAAAAGWGAITEAQGGNHFTLRSRTIAAPSKATYPSGRQRHPRTGLGVTADGRVLMVTVDGRRTKSRGVTLPEMGQLMKSLGAVHAFNLDGGGSTVMARHMVMSGQFRVANQPSDGKQRPATQAFAVFMVTP